MDSETIGTFGLGALTMYHFTDLISVVSGDQVLFLDVNKSYLPVNKATNKINSSMKGNFIDKKLLERYPGQFQPYTRFQSIFGSSMKEKLNGTLFRLPLRTKETALQSNVKKRAGLGGSNFFIS